MYGQVDLDLEKVGTGDFVVIDDVMILPSVHAACQHLRFFCPGVEVSGSPWSYECPLEGEEPESRRAQLRGQRRLETTFTLPYSVDEESSHSFSSAAHDVMDEDVTESSNTESISYVLLPGNNGFCLQGGTKIIYSDEGPSACTTLELDFDKAEDGRPLAGRTFVADEWFPQLGIKISAKSHDGPQNVHPMIFDSENIDESESSHLGSPNNACGGPGEGDGGKIGAQGEICELLGNVLIPSRKDGTSGDSEFGILVFEFHEDTTVNSISLLNVDDDESQVTITQEDGTSTNIALSSVGQNGFQTIEVGLEKVNEFAVSLKSLAAVASLSLCILPTGQ